MTWRVLVVDDEQSLAKVVASYLERDGHRVNCVFDGPSAVAAARQRPPDVVVLDLGLPGHDGIEVCRQLRTFTDCYVVMITVRTGATFTVTLHSAAIGPASLGDRTPEA